MSEHSPLPTAAYLETRIDAAKSERERHFTAKCFVESSRWDGRLDILKEWLAALRQEPAMVLVLVVALLVAPARASAQDKDCSVTSSGLVPAVYERTAAHELAGMIAAGRVKPRLADGTPVAFGQGGKIVVLFKGFSNFNNFQARLAIFLQGTLRTANGGKLPPEYAFLEGAQNTQATGEWETDAPWNQVDVLLASKGVTRQQVQVIISMEAQRYPLERGAMRAEQVTHTVAIGKSRFQNLTVQYLMSLGYVGYRAKVGGPAEAQRFINGDGYLLRELAETQVGIPNGVWFDYLPIEADGIIPNPATASKSYPNGLAFTCDMIKPDGIHYTGQGTVMLPINIGERVSIDPVWRVAMGLQAPPDVEPEEPTEEPTDPDPPVTVPVPGAVTKDGANCTLKVTVPSGALMTMAVPASWCSGL